jgi:tight adherence protein C
MVSPVLVCVALLGLQQINPRPLMLVAACAGCLGFVLPAAWLRWKINRRQSNLREALPDFLDIIVVCLEGGMSFESALQRTTDELQEAHPALARELVIVQRELAIGRAADDALQNMARRTGLPVLKTLANNVRQARRLGIRLAEDLRTQAAILRTQREQRAEELAQKASVKILFPTLIFIFPTIFVVVVGPAAFQIREMFAESSDEVSTQDLPQLPQPIKR